MQHSTDETFHSDSFRKELVLQRLRKQAIKLWGLQESDAESFDPVIDLMMGACAVEFERTGQQIHTSQARVLERLAQLMVPEVLTSARPAHALMHARADVPVTTLKKSDQFAALKEITNGNSTSNLQVYFSPVTECRLFNAEIICHATSNTLQFYNSPVSKGDTLYAEKQMSLPQGTLWLGIKLDDKIDTLKGMTFFIDWKNDPRKPEFIPLLAMGNWYSGGVLLGVHAGLDNGTSKKTVDKNETLKEVEDTVLHYYHSQLLSVHSDFTPQSKYTYPVEFGTVFGQETLKKLKEELLWVEVRFPAGLASKALKDVYCSINCFPVMNRRLHAASRPYTLANNLNIIPLHLEEHFLSIKRVYAQDHEYHSVSADGIHSMQDGTYAVRQSGVSRFDQRDASSILQYLYELMRDESAAFKALGNYALNTEIKNLDQSLVRLNMHFLDRETAATTKCHLFLHAKEQEDVWVEYWSTQGDKANRLPTGKKLNPVSAAHLAKPSMMLVSSSTGGKEPMDESERLFAFRYALQTRSRIATEEDIKAACFAELGNKIEHVEIKKGIKKDPVSKSGFTRTIDVILEPAEGFEQIEWIEICNELQAYLHRNKLFLTDIRVFTTSHTNAYVAG